MLYLASIPTAAGPPASCFVKNGPGFHQTLIGLGLAFTLPQPLHRLLPLAIPSSSQDNAGPRALTLAQAGLPIP